MDNWNYGDPTSNDQLSWVSSQGSKKLLEKLMEGATAQHPPSTTLPRSVSAPPSRTHSLIREKSHARTAFTKHNSAPSTSSVIFSSIPQSTIEPSASATSSFSASRKVRRLKRNASALEDEFQAFVPPPHIPIESVEALIRNVSRTLNEGAVQGGEGGASGSRASSQSGSGTWKTASVPVQPRRTRCAVESSSMRVTRSRTLHDTTNKRSREDIRSSDKGKGKEILHPAMDVTEESPAFEDTDVDIKMQSPPPFLAPPPRLPQPRRAEPTIQSQATPASPISPSSIPSFPSPSLPRGTQRSLGMKGPPSRFKNLNTGRASTSSTGNTSRRAFKVPFRPPSAVPAPSVALPNQSTVSPNIQVAKTPDRKPKRKTDESPADAADKSFGSDYSFGIDGDALEDAMKQFD